jgi:hypothetical protein
MCHVLGLQAEQWYPALLTSPLALPVALCRTLVAQEQARIRQQYEERLRELESERQSVQEDKAQVGAVGGWC